MTAGRHADLISTAYVNPGGSLVVYGLAFDLDAHRAAAVWKDEDGRLDWERMSAHLAQHHGEIARAISHVVRSSGGQGLGLVIAINPLPLIERTERNQRVALNLQSRLVNLFSELGFGADRAARGLVRDLPNFRDPSRCLREDTLLVRRIEATRAPVVSSLHRYLNELGMRQRAERRIYPDARVEAGLAKLMELLLGSHDPGLSGVRVPSFATGERVWLTVQQLEAVTGASASFLRRFLGDPPQWLEARYESRELGWCLALRLGRLSERLLARAATLLASRPAAGRKIGVSVATLCRPESVVDGERNGWVTSLALAYKWAGIPFEEALSRVALRASLIPDAARSRSHKECRRIVRSIYRNVPQTLGMHAGRELPDWLLDDAGLTARPCSPGKRARVTPAMTLNVGTASPHLPMLEDSEGKVSSSTTRRGVAPVGLADSQGLWSASSRVPLTAENFSLASPAVFVASASALAPAARAESDSSERVAKGSRCVRLVAIRRRQRVGIFEGDRLVVCVTKRHYRAAKMIAFLEQRAEYAGIELRIHTPHRAAHERYFAAIDACEVALSSGTILGRRPTWSMQYSLREAIAWEPGQEVADALDFERAVSHFEVDIPVGVDRAKKPSEAAELDAPVMNPGHDKPASGGDLEETAAFLENVLELARLVWE